jgi:hypothetical protein
MAYDTHWSAAVIKLLPELSPRLCKTPPVLEMSLHTPPYLIFLSIVVVLYWLPHLRHLRKPILLLASFTFYALFDLRFLALLLFLIVTTFYLGRNS